MALRTSTNEREWCEPEATGMNAQTDKFIRVRPPLLIRAIDKAIFPKQSALEPMPDSEAIQEIKLEILAAVGKWAIGIIVTIMLGGFAAGVWSTTRDMRINALETQAKKTSKMEYLIIKLCQKNGIDTSRIEE